MLQRNKEKGITIKMGVSIIVPVYNVELYLERLIQSALKQSYKQIELILINDGSTDLSGKICDKYQKIDSRVKVIHQENKGVSSARNKGLKICTQEYVYFADSDDYFDISLIQDNLNIAEQNKAEVILFGHIIEKKINDKKVLKQKREPVKISTFSKKEFRDNFSDVYISSPRVLWNKLYKRSYLLENKCEFPSQRLGEDFLFNIDVYQNLSNFVVNDQTYYHYVYRKDSAFNKYDKNRAIMEYKLAEEFEKLMIHWNKKEQYQEFIMNEYINVLRHELLTLSSKDCNMNNAQKREMVHNLITNEKIFFSLQKYTQVYKKKSKEAVLYILMKNRLYLTAINIMKLRTIVKR